MVNQLYCDDNQLHYLSQFIHTHRLQAGDAIIVAEEGKGLVRNLLDHYVVYLGDYYFMANFKKGTKILTCPEIYTFIPYMTVRRIRRFMGNYLERQQAVKRALRLKDRDSYHLIVNNCEHFANEVQYGTAYSDQSLIGGGLTLLLGLGLCCSSNSNTRAFGGALTAIGGITAGNELLRRI